MTKRVFYSWQDDLDPHANRYFIEDCLKRAIKNLNRSDLSDLIVDRDTKNVPGMPDIGQTIFEKISSSRVVVADLSIINPGPIRRSDERPVPNPNVLFELGYAFAKLGAASMVGVFNTVSGSIDELPFHIRPRQLLTYHLGEGDDKSSVRDELVKDLEKAVRASLGETEEQRIERNSEIIWILSHLVLFAEETDCWHSGDRLHEAILEHRIAADKLPDLMTQSGASQAHMNIVSHIVAKMRQAAAPEINEENLPSIKRSISSSGPLARWVLDSLGYTISDEYRKELVGRVTQIPSQLDEEISHLANFELHIPVLARIAHDLRLSALRPVIEHPAFGDGLKAIGLDLRRLVLQWTRDTPNARDATAALASIRDRLSELIAKYCHNDDPASPETVADDSE